MIHYQIDLVAQGVDLLDFDFHHVAKQVGPARAAAHQLVLAGTVFVPIILERTDMHQAFHLGRRHLHKEAVALNAADATRQGLTHQWFGGPGLGHRHHVVLKLLNEPTTAVETVGQPMAEAVLERGQLGRRQQGPIDGAVARIRSHCNSNFVAHGGTVLTVYQQADQ